MTDILIYRLWDNKHKRYVRPSHSNRSIWENPGPCGALLNRLNKGDTWLDDGDLYHGRYERHVFELRRIK